MSEVTCEDQTWAVKAYFEACNSGDRKAFSSLFLPKGMAGPFLDVESLFARWRRDAEENDSFWIIENCLADAGELAAFAEWTAVKPQQRIQICGVNWFGFASGRQIEEDRVHCATAWNLDLGPNELGGHEYAGACWWTSEYETRAFGDI